MTFEHKVTVNLIPPTFGKVYAKDVIDFVEEKRQTIAWSIDDAKYLAKNGLDGSVVKLWNAGYFSLAEQKSIIDDSELKIEYWNMFDYLPYVRNVEDLLISKEIGYGDRKYTDIFFIAIHHTVSWDYNATNLKNAQRIADYHVYTKNWPGAGYHYLICPDGEILALNSIYKISYHVGTLRAPTDENKESIGIALGGDFRTQKPTDPQIYSASALVQNLKGYIPNSVGVLPHKRMHGAATICPGIFELESWLKIVSGDEKWI